MRTDPSLRSFFLHVWPILSENWTRRTRNDLPWGKFVRPCCLVQALDCARVWAIEFASCAIGGHSNCTLLPTFPIRAAQQKMITEETCPYKLRIVPRIANAILVRSIVQFLNNAPTLTIISVCRPWPFMLLSLFRSA